MSKNILFSAKNIKKSFGTNVVLKDISMDVAEGETVAILGPSGSGKTPLLRIATILEKADFGTIEFIGKSAMVNKPEEKSVYADHQTLANLKNEYGLVFQNFNLFPHMTVLKNLMSAPVTVQKRAPQEVEAEARQLLERVGLSDKAGAYPGSLSGGQQQRVAIARALTMNPKVLFFDEPTSALDPENTLAVLKLIQGLAAEGRTMVIVTHEIEFARKAADKIIFMDGGLIVEEGTPEEVLNNSTNERTRAFLDQNEDF